MLKFQYKSVNVKVYKLKQHEYNNLDKIIFDKLLKLKILDKKIRIKYKNKIEIKMLFGFGGGWGVSINLYYNFVTINISWLEVSSV